MPTDGIQSDRSNLGEGVSLAGQTLNRMNRACGPRCVFAVRALHVVEARGVHLFMNRGGPSGIWGIRRKIIFITNPSQTPPLAAPRPLHPTYSSPTRPHTSRGGAVMSQVPYAIYAMSARAKRTRTSRLEMLNHSQFKAWPSTLIDPMGRVMSQGS